MLTDEQKKLIEENHGLIYKYISIRGLDKDEWYDILAERFCKIIPQYDPKKGKLSTLAFKAFTNEILAFKAFTNEITMLAKTSHYDCREANNGTVSIFSNRHKNYGEVSLIERMVSDEDLLEDVVILSTTYNSFKAKQSKRDQYILTRREDGLTSKEIGDELGFSRAWVAKIVQKLKVQFVRELRDDRYLSSHSKHAL